MEDWKWDRITAATEWFAAMVLFKNISSLLFSSSAMKDRKDCLIIAWMWLAQQWNTTAESEVKNTNRLLIKNQQP